MFQQDIGLLVHCQRNTY